MFLLLKNLQYDFIFFLNILLHSFKILKWFYSTLVDMGLRIFDNLGIQGLST